MHATVWAVWVVIVLGAHFRNLQPVAGFTRRILRQIFSALLVRYGIGIVESTLKNNWTAWKGASRLVK
jgi:hypothetical protein